MMGEGGQGGKGNLLEWKEDLGGGGKKHCCAAAACVAYLEQSGNCILLAYEGKSLDATNSFQTEIVALDLVLDFLSSL